MSIILLRGTLSFENYSQTLIKLTVDDQGFVTEYFFDKKTSTIDTPSTTVNGEHLYIRTDTLANPFQFIYADVINPVTQSVDEFLTIANGWFYTGGPEVSVNSGTSVGPLNILNFIEGSNITITAVDNLTTNSVDITISSTGSGSGVTAVTATGLLTSSGGTTPDISSQVNKGKLVGRNSVTAGIMEEISIGSGLTLSGTTLSASVNSSITHATASGTDTYTVSITGVASYADGDAYLIRFTNGNTTGCTLNINGLGAIDLYRNNDGALIGGDIETESEMLIVYNLSLNIFQCIGTSPNSLISYVTNADSVTITKGQPVYAYGGQGDRLTVKRAYNTSDATSAQTIGLVMSTSIAVGQKGFILMQGLLDGLSILPTITWADGDPVYLGPTAGSISKVKPYAPNHLVYLGFVTTASNGSAGRLYVRVQNGYELDELHNVQAQSPSANDTIYYDSVASQWKTASLATILGYTPVATTRTISTTTPLSGGGDLSANRTLSITQSATGTDGYLSSTDWNTFNNATTDRRSGNYYRKSQRWYVPSDNTNTLTATNHSTPSVFLVPMPVHKTMIIDQIAVEVTTAGAVGSTLRFGIYNGDATTVVPTTLVVDSGDISAASIGVKTFTPGSPITLTPGLYFTAFSTSSASVVGVRSLTTTNFAQVIGLTAAGGTSLGTYINGTRAAYGALPANASSLTALNPTIGNIYALFYRIQ